MIFWKYSVEDNENSDTDYDEFFGDSKFNPFE